MDRATPVHFLDWIGQAAGGDDEANTEQKTDTTVPG